MDKPKCANCGHPKSEHHYNGACYGLCGEFVMPAPMDKKFAIVPVEPTPEMWTAGAQIDPRLPHADVLAWQVMLAAAPISDAVAVRCADLELLLDGPTSGSPEIIEKRDAAKSRIRAALKEP